MLFLFLPSQHLLRGKMLSYLTWQRKTDKVFVEKLHRQRSLFFEVYPIPLNLFELLLFLSTPQALLFSILALQCGGLQRRDKSRTFIKQEKAKN